MTTQQEFENRTEALNQPTIQLDRGDELKVGWDEIGDFISQLVVTTTEEKGRVPDRATMEKWVHWSRRYL